MKGLQEECDGMTGAGTAGAIRGERVVHGGRRREGRGSEEEECMGDSAEGRRVAEGAGRRKEGYKEGQGVVRGWDSRGQDVGG
eukprot:55588-Rhodomonas_salina.1